MGIICPGDKRLKIWKDLVDSVGENKAYFLWNAYKGVVPSNFYKINYTQEELVTEKSETKEEVKESIKTTPKRGISNKNISVIGKGKVTRLNTKTNEQVDDLTEAFDYNSITLNSLTLLSNFTEEQNIINSLTTLTLQTVDNLHRQNEVLEEGKKIPVTIETALEEVKSNLQQEYEFFNYYATNPVTNEAIEEGAYESNEDNAQLAANIKLILDNFEVVKTGEQIDFVGFKYRIIDNIQRLKYSIQEDFDTVEDELEKNNFESSFSFKTDPEKSMSAKVKRMLSFIPKVNEYNSLGYQVYEDYSKVYNLISDELVDTPMDEMLSVLEDLSTINPIIGTVLTQLQDLKATDTDAYNRFFVVFKRQHAILKTIGTYGKDENGNLSYSVFNSNRSSAPNMIVDTWHENFKTKGLESGLLNINKSTGDITIDTNKGKEINKEFRDILQSKDTFKIKLQKLTNVFSKIGIEMSVEEFEKINSDRAKNKRKYLKFYTPQKDFTGFLGEEMSYIFRSLTGSENAEVNEPWQANNPFYTQGSKRIMGLANYHATFHPEIYSSSHRNANRDLVYTNIMPSHLSNRLQLIKRNKKYREALKSIPFSSQSIWLEEDVELSYFDGSVNFASYQDAKSFEEQNPVEKELTKIAMFQKGGKSMFIGNTPSDKTTFPLFEFNKHEINFGENAFIDGKIGTFDINSPTVEYIFKRVVLPEIKRINSVTRHYNASTDKRDLIPGYHYFKDGSLGSGSYFFFIPELNDIVKDFKTSDNIIKPTVEDINQIKQVIANKLTSLTQAKVESWQEKGIVDFNEGINKFNKTYASKLKVNKDNKQQNIINYAAADMVTNYMLSYANQFMVITGDPALFTKAGYEFKNWQKLIDDTADNIFKRTAKDIAPGIEGKFEDTHFNSVFINEPKSSSIMKDYSERLGITANAYGKLDIADAQEWTTAEEHINVLFAFGKIDATTRNNLLNKINKRKDAVGDAKKEFNFTLSELGTVLQPMKPVYVTSTIKDDINTDIHYYIKTSSFPLIPQLTEGLEIDKLRKVMEQKNIHRAVVNSGVKTGFHNGVDVFNSKGEINVSGIEEGIHNLSREGFRIQQEVPYDPTKNEILEGSQPRKLVFADLTPDMEFSLYGKAKRGYELKKISDNIHNTLYSIRYEKLLKQLGLEETSTITDVENLRKVLVDEAQKLDYDHDSILLLNTLKLDNGRVIFEVPLIFHNEANKIEAMLNSIIKNRVLKNKVSGMSTVQGSSAGFKPVLRGEDFLKYILSNTDAKIAYTKHFTGELDYREYEENGQKIIYGEVFAPFKFLTTDKNGEKLPLDLKNFVDENGFIKEDKIDDSLLNMLGYRIPTSGHNSMLKLKVVGFLPQEAGDLTIVPAAITKQMGSDFDVDKLYIQFYNYKFTKGMLQKVDVDTTKDIDEMSEAELQNYNLDIMFSILDNVDVQNRYQFQPIDNKDLSNEKDRINKLRKPDKKLLNKITPSKSSIVSDEYQSHMVDVNAAGKIGVGSYSSAITNHVLFQYAGVHITTPTNKDGNPMYNKAIPVMFKREDGTLYNDKLSGDDYLNNRVNNIEEINYYLPPKQGAWRLDKVKTFNGKLISTVLKNYQTESVDNAKNQVLFDLFQNKDTFRVTKLIVRAGFDEQFVTSFMNQPIIVRYVNELNNANNFTENDFDPNIEEKIQNKLFEELGIKPESLLAPSLSEMNEAIANGGIDKKFQAGILYNFIKYKEVAQQIGKIESAINTDTAFLGQSIYSSILKLQDLQDDYNNLGNLPNLVNGTTQGGAIAYGLQASIELFADGNLFPTNSFVITDTIKQIEQLIGRRLNEENVYKVISDIRASIFINAVQEVYGKDIDTLRKELLYGTDKIKSLAKEIAEYQLITDNIFIKGLHTNISYKTENPDTIEFISSKEIKKDLSAPMVLAWKSLLDSPTGSKEKEIGEKLVMYSLLIGNQRNAKDFGRFLPSDYIKKSGLSKYYRSIDWYTDNDFTNNMLTNFVTQWIQHNPYRVKEITSEHIKSAKDNKGNSVKKGDAPHLFTIKNIDEAGMQSIYVEVDGEIDSPKFLRLTDSNKKIHLYQKINNVYTEIPQLGFTKNIKEYNINNSRQQSIFRGEVSNVVVNKVETIVKKDVPRIETLFDKYNFDKGKSSVLDNIIANSNNETNKAVAQFLKDNLDSFNDYSLEEFDINIHGNDRDNSDTSNKLRGRTLHGRKIIAINKNTNINEAKFEESILHEFTHALLYSKLGKESKVNKELLDLINSIPKDRLSNVEWLRSIGIEDIIDGKWKYSELSFSNTQEFAAFMMSNEDFQKILSNLEESKDKSFLEKIKELIFKIFGIEAKGKLAEGLGIIIDIVESNQSTEETTIISNDIKKEITGKLATAIKESARKHLPKEQVKSLQATQYIGDGAKDSSTDRYRELYSSYGIANTGNYSSNDIVWVSSNGRRNNRVNPVSNGKLQGVYTNIDKAIAAKASIIMDTKSHIENTKGYNIGEVALAEYMENSGYKRVGDSGLWKPTEEVQTKTVQPGVEISSNAKGLAGALTNPTELAKRKGNIKFSYPIEYNGKVYRDVEAAYQANKAPYLKNNTTDRLMVDLIEIKLRKYPKLTEKITEVGGREWILASTHQPTKQNSYWETGGQNGFILALAEAYDRVISKPKSGQLSLFEDLTEPNRESLGSTVIEFMKELTPEQRTILREDIKTGQIKFKC